MVFHPQRKLFDDLLLEVWFTVHSIDGDLICSPIDEFAALQYVIYILLTYCCCQLLSEVSAPDSCLGGPGCNDQRILNIYFRNRVHYLSMVWNAPATHLKVIGGKEHTLNTHHMLGTN